MWENYCKKGEQFMSKKVAQQFFKDALILLGYRKNKEPKVLLGQVKEKDALETAFAYLSQDGKTVTFEKWKLRSNLSCVLGGASFLISSFLQGDCYFLLCFPLC